jgi:tripartite-type tricarboxylate transporter receptor subunit TctC
MKLPRRQFLHLVCRRSRAAGGVACRMGASLSVAAGATIVGQAAGSGSDTAARLIGQFLSERLGQQLVIENWPGASGNIATEAVARAPPTQFIPAKVSTIGTLLTLMMPIPG